MSSYLDYSIKTRQEFKDWILRQLGYTDYLVDLIGDIEFDDNPIKEKLYEKYHEQGFEVLDFPCNQFGHQAPGDNNEIHEFCTAKYKTQFDQLAKIDVNGENQSPVFAFIKKEIKKDEISGFKNKMVMNGIKKISKTATDDGDILWNFTKFLVDKNGNVVKRYSPIMDPMKMEDEIVKLLK